MCADVLDAALDGKLGTTELAVNQVVLPSTLVYILPPIAMVVLSLLLRPRANRITNIAVSLLYTATILVSCIGETWVYYLLGSAVEAVLLLVIARTAWKWPAHQSAAAVGNQPTVEHMPPSGWDQRSSSV